MKTISISSRTTCTYKFLQMRLTDDFCPVYRELVVGLSELFDQDLPKKGQFYVKMSFTSVLFVNGTDLTSVFFFFVLEKKSYVYS